MDIVEYNRQAWNRQVESGNQWTQPVSPELVAKARSGQWEVLLTQQRPVPRSWFPELKGLDVLGLASGGGQQGPILAAAGANVTIFDNSPGQLEQDRHVAEREGLTIQTIQGDMAKLDCFADASFDLVFNPCSISFISDVRAVWREAARVLRPGGLLLTGFLNPAMFIFDETLAEKGQLKVRHSLPYSDLDNLTEAEIQALKTDNEPLMFSHSLEALIGGQAEAGLSIRNLYEDTWSGRVLSDFMPSFIATRAVKL